MLDTCNIQLQVEFIPRRMDKFTYMLISLGISYTRDPRIHLYKEAEGDACFAEILIQSSENADLR